MFQEKMAGDGNDPDDLIIQAFKAYDVEGKIDVKMFQHALSTWGDKMTKAESDDIFGEFDIDEDYMVKTKEVLVNVELTEDVVNLGLGHLVSPGGESVLEHLDVDLALDIVGLEGLDDQVIGVVAITGHLLLEHLDHVVVGAETGDLSKETVELSLGHEDTDVVDGSAEVIFVDGSILVDVHQLEAVLVHVKLLLGEASLILTLAHGCVTMSRYRMPYTTDFSYYPS